MGKFSYLYCQSATWAADAVFPTSRTRNCVGLTLAYEELYLAVAGVFRRLDLELYETDFSDVNIIYDNYTPKARLDSKGVRVLVK